jgi:hypothetical protein
MKGATHRQGLVLAGVGNKVDMGGRGARLVSERRLHVWVSTAADSSGRVLRRTTMMIVPCIIARVLSIRAQPPGLAGMAEERPGLRSLWTRGILPVALCRAAEARRKARRPSQSAGGG